MVKHVDIWVERVQAEDSECRGPGPGLCEKQQGGCCGQSGPSAGSLFSFFNNLAVPSLN